MNATGKRLVVAAALALTVLLSSCVQRYAPQKEDSSVPMVSSHPSRSEVSLPELPTEDRFDRVTLLAAGDNLIHDAIYIQANERAAEGEYDFRPVYERLRSQIAAADLAFINQETPMAASFAPATYPMFNTPVQMADNLREIGFDVLNISNNHMIDKGVDGLLETIRLIRSTPGLTMVGAYETAAEYNQPPIVERNGIKFAFVGATQHTNGLSLPEDRSDLAVYTDELDAIERLITRARELADVVVVSVHWGDEGTTQVNLYQQGIAQHLADFGADIVIGTHPHVLQPTKTLDRPDGGKTIVMYSLGNFVSAQSKPINLVGALAELTIERNHTTRNITISQPVFTPIVTHYGPRYADLSLYPLEDYTAELAAQHGVVGMSGQRFDLEYIQALLEEAVLLEESSAAA